MTLKSTLAGATALARTGSFAHLIGLGRAPSATEPAPAADPAPPEPVAPVAAAPEAAPQPAPEPTPAPPAAAKAESDDDMRRATNVSAGRDPDDDGDDDDDDEGDDDKDRDEMAATSPHRAARLRERARCAAIFADAAAALNPGLAAQLAFNTDLPRAQAVVVLKAGGSAKPSLAARMAGAVAAVPPDAPPAPPAQPGASTVAIYERLRPAKK